MGYHVGRVKLAIKIIIIVRYEPMQFWGFIQVNVNKPKIIIDPQAHRKETELICKGHFED